MIKGICCILPAIPLFLNYSLCNQSQNYTAYEHALNIFRTTDYGSILFLEGDNNFFPVVYGRIAEGMREDVILYDRHHIIFKMPYLGERRGRFYGNWEKYKRYLESSVVEKMAPVGIHYATFVPSAISLPGGYSLIPDGILHEVAMRKDPGSPYRINNVWVYYSSESFYDSYEKDFMNRQIHAHFFLRYGQYYFLAKQPAMGLKYFQNASRAGYDDTVVQSAIAYVLADNGLYERASEALKNALVNQTDPGIIQNSWGVLFYKMGAFEKAIERFRRAVKKKPEEFQYYKNLAYALHKSGKKEDALNAFKESLKINPNQPDIKTFMEVHGLGEKLRDSGKVMPLR